MGSVRIGTGIGAVAPPGGGGGDEVEAKGVYLSLGSLAGPYPDVRATAPVPGGGGGGLWFAYSMAMSSGGAGLAGSCA